MAWPTSAASPGPSRSSLQQAGARLVITYQNQRLEEEAKDLIAALPGAEAFMCDVSSDEQIDQLFAQLKSRYGKLHTLVHSIAFAPADELKGEFLPPRARASASRTT